MAEMLLPNKLAFSTARITSVSKDGTQSVGTGFFVHFPSRRDERVIPALVTNRHVIESAMFGWFELTLFGTDGLPKFGTTRTIAVDGFASRWIPHPDDTVDLCVFPVGSLINEANAAGKPFFYSAFAMDVIATPEMLAELSAIEDVIMVGYPIGLSDRKNNMPICRKGITATRPDLDYEGRKEFVIDIACFPGSSGSPVVLLNVGGHFTKDGGVAIGPGRFMFLGILFAGPQFTVEGKLEVVPVPTKMQPIAKSLIPMNLGFVIKAERLFEFVPILQAAMPPENTSTESIDSSPTPSPTPPPSSK